MLQRALSVETDLDVIRVVNEKEDVGGRVGWGGGGCVERHAFNRRIKK